MFAPQNGEFVADVSEPVLASGLIPSPNTEVQLQIYDTFAKKWLTYGSALSEGEPAITDKTGQSYYQWSKELSLPGGDMYWKMKSFSPSAGGLLKARVRATLGLGSIPLPTLDEGETENCVVTEYLKTEVGAQAVAKCQRGVREVELTTPCGGPGQLCCTLAPQCWPAPGQTSATCKKFDQAKSVSRCEVLLLPTLKSYAYPKFVDFAEGGQGIAHDQASWYLSAEAVIMKFSLGADLATAQPTKTGKPFSSEFKHYGDVSWNNGKLYIPLEKGTGSSANAIGIVDSNFAELGLHYLPEANGASWCEVANGILYSSDNTIQAPNPVVRRYKVAANGVTLTRIEDLVLRNHDYDTEIGFKLVQGGAVSLVSNTLFLSTGSTPGTQGLDAVWAFDLATGGFRGVTDIPTGAVSGTFPFDDPEVEGLDYFDDPPSPNISGRLHVFVAHNTEVFGETDNYTLIHYDVVNASDAPRF